MLSLISPLLLDRASHIELKVQTKTEGVYIYRPRAATFCHALWLEGGYATDI